MAQFSKRGAVPRLLYTGDNPGTIQPALHQHNVHTITITIIGVGIQAATTFYHMVLIQSTH